jgi:hypothetical protein
VVRPGDKLVVRLSRDVTYEQAHEFKARAEAKLPGVEVVIICADEMAVYRGDTP